MERKEPKGSDRISGIAVTVALVAGIVFAVVFGLERKATYDLGANALDLNAALNALKSDGSASADRRVRLAERLVEAGATHDVEARALLKQALADDPNAPTAWSLLAFVEHRISGAFSPDAQTAFRRSVEVCPMCNADLIRWRLDFVLANWDDTPEDLRKAAFVGADFLRWWHLDYEFVASRRALAISQGIPFVQYQRAVNTPVRPEEIG